MDGPAVVLPRLPAGNLISFEIVFPLTVCDGRGQLKIQINYFDDVCTEKLIHLVFKSDLIR